MKRAAIFFLLVLSLSGVSAAPELWIGASFAADRNIVSEDIAASFPAMGESISVIRSLGLDLDLTFFPFEEVRIGATAGYSVLLPIGISEAGGPNIGYITYDIDTRQDAYAGIAYYQFFTPVLGAFLTCSFQYSWYRTAMAHIPNDSAPMEFFKEEEYGVMGELGIITRSGNMYFRLGIAGFYDLKHLENPGYRFTLLAGGGMII
ncbi:MAG: hypothetical protein IAA97_04215 [Spirochaetes bacterium]|uniref:Outer membrane protein beta-barrel domain-containing protein n=1 Tax=Candidatus Ornithospirochaeta stercoripullorum TaxID=2840899 RepID=A0A9D9H616_9SPIO|nr:hypothetical protein [Candidatus Ornithospirochaeta stercoripullorum]